MAHDTIIVAGSLAQKPFQPGHTWQFLQYLLGFRRLGFEVVLVDRLEPEMCLDRSGSPCSLDESANLAYLISVIDAFDLRDSFALLYDGGRRIVGMPREKLRRKTVSSTLLLNVMGFLADEDIVGSAPLSVFLDTDPGFGQMWHELGLANLFQGHDSYVTIAENIGQETCSIPTCGVEWLTTRQPVVLEAWARTNGGVAERFTSIGAWRGAYGPVEYRGETYGQRVHEFRKFVDLPRLTGVPFEVALDIDGSDARDIALLDDRGWLRVDPAAVASDPRAYRDYIHGSLAELMVAREMYVKSRCGWFSERSMCYLASGRPVLAQDTGVRDLYPSGEGLIVFSTLDEAVAGVEAICRDYERHSRAAACIAAEYFDSDRVLGGLLEKLSVG